MAETYNFPSNIEAVANKCGCVFTDKNDFQDIVKESQYEIEKIIITFLQNRKYCTLNEKDLINSIMTIYPYENIKDIISKLNNNFENLKKYRKDASSVVKKGGKHQYIDLVWVSSKMNNYVNDIFNMNKEWLTIKQSIDYPSKFDVMSKCQDFDVYISALCEHIITHILENAKNFENHVTNISFHKSRMRFHIKYDDRIEIMYQKLHTIDNPEEQQKLENEISLYRKELNQKERMERRLDREYRNRLRSDKKKKKLIKTVESIKKGKEDIISDDEQNEVSSEEELSEEEVASDEEDMSGEEDGVKITKGRKRSDSLYSNKDKDESEDSGDESDINLDEDDDFEDTKKKEVEVKETSGRGGRGRGRGRGGRGRGRGRGKAKA